MSKLLHIIHLELKQPKENEKIHYYFGSKAALYQHFTSDRIGIKYTSLANRNRRNADDIIYNNKYCVIYRHDLIVRNNSDPVTDKLRRSSQHDE